MISKRFPPLKDIISVYAVVAFIVQAWTINLLFTQLSSWTNYLDVNEILAIFSYRIAESFMESLLVVGVLVLISFILPQSFFRNVFVIRGTAFAMVSLGSFIIFWKRFQSDPGVTMADYTQIWTIGTITLASLFSYAVTKFQALADFFDWISESMTVFLYILVPLSLISVITVVIRNID